MTDDEMRQWNSLSDYVTAEQLRIMIEVAVHHLSHASAGTKSAARATLSVIRVPGFRAFDHVPPQVAQFHLTQAFPRSPLIAGCIVGLWAEARADLLAEVRKRTEELSEGFKPRWTWDEGVVGFKPIDASSILHKTAVDLAAEKPENEADEIWLAVYVLSCALSPGTAAEPLLTETTQDMPENSMEAMATTDDSVADSNIHGAVSPADEDLLAAEPAQETPLDLAAINLSPATGAYTSENAHHLAEVIAPPVVTPEQTLLGDALTPAPEVLPITVVLSDDLVQPPSLEQVRHQLETSQAAMTAAREATLTAVRGLQSAIDTYQLSQAETCLAATRAALNQWITTHSDLKTVIVQAIERLHMELQLRLDLDRDGTLQSHIETARQADTITATYVPGVLKVVDQVLHYDQARTAVLADLDKLHRRTSALLGELAAWSDGDDREEDRILGLKPEPRETQLDALKIALSQAKAQFDKTQSKLSQIRELRLNRVMALAQSLREHNLTPSPQIGPHLTLTEIEPEAMSRLSGKEVKEIEQKLSDLLNEQTLGVRQSVVNELASDLRQRWQDDLVSDLIGRLALQRRDVEALLLLLAANHAHPRTELLNLNKNTVDGLLRGIGQLSDKAAPFELITLLASDFLNGWQSTDVTAQVKLSILFLSAHYGGGYALPSGFLWQLPHEWPLETMPSWATLWQAALLDAPRPDIQRASQVDVVTRLGQARQEAVQMLARDAGSFVHLRSLRSKRHIAMLSIHLLPALAAKLTDLQQIEQSLSVSPGAPVLKRLERMVAEMETECSEKELVDRYEAGISAEDINDNDSFHRRTALRMLQDCAEGLLNYGRLLLEYANWRRLGVAQVTRSGLEQELNALPDASAFERAALEQVCAPDLPTQQECDDAAARALAQRKITKELLTDAVYALRIPHTVGYLTGTSLAWDRILDPLLSDLCVPADAETAAGILMEQEAPNQVLWLTKNGISLEKQNLAQQLMDQKSRAVSDSQTELLRLGSTAEDLNEDRQLGRWRFVQQQLSIRLEEERAAREQGRRASQQKAAQLRRSINELDENVFAIRDTIVMEARQLVERGLQVARQGTSNTSLLPVIETYLRELKYRLDHNSWPLVELQNSVEELERAISGEANLSQDALTSNEVIELLENSELRRLGLSPNMLSSSEVGTRIDTLRHWGRVRLLPTVMSEELGTADRSAIQALYQSFAQMVVMKYYRRRGDKPIVVEHPSVYSWYELSYPKTEALELYCVLLALPGNPPNSHDIKQIENLIDDRKWLEDGFVLLFIPGCTPKIAGRFRSVFRNQRLVILDEPAMLSIILAEAEFKTPLGRLRALMLNVHGAAEVDIYKVNQPVDPRTAIFVGRDALVDRIALSGNNYAIYGGRRIGKSSVLKAVERRLASKETKTVYFSFEGHSDYSDDATATMLAALMRTRWLIDNFEVATVDDFQLGIQTYLELNPAATFALLLDEIDRYIESNPNRHVFIETLRALSDRFTNRFRVMIAGFMKLYDCMRGRGPYSPTSDPWRRMLNDPGPLDNLKASQAEQIVTEGFLHILGWKFENRALPQWIVERTGGHPAFVQCFCERLQRRTANRQDQMVRLDDVVAVFEDQDPNHSFIAYVKSNLEWNLRDPISRFLVLLLASESSQARGFTLAQIRELARLSKTPIPESYLLRSLDTLAVNSVVKEFAPQVYEFSVPDYPLILERLGQTQMGLTTLEQEIAPYLELENGRNR